MHIILFFIIKKSMHNMAVFTVKLTVILCEICSSIRVGHSLNLPIKHFAQLQPKKKHQMTSCHVKTWFCLRFHVTCIKLCIVCYNCYNKTSNYVDKGSS